jgi:hypothetical protein
VLANITVQFQYKDLQFQAKDGLQKSIINLFGRVTTMTRRPVTTFEKTLDASVPSELLQKLNQGSAIYQQSVPLAPGRYRLNVVAKDVIGGTLNNYEVALDVPHFSEEKLASSSLILADDISRLPTRSIGGGMFAIGDTKVRPRLGNTFKRDEKLGIYLQVYNFEPDEKTQKPSGEIEYEIDKVNSTDKILDFTEDIAKLPNASANQVTIAKLLPLKNIPPGVYTLKIKATDKRANQTLPIQSENFTVN